MKSTHVSLQSRLIKTAMLSSIIAGIFAFVFLLSFSIYQSMNMQDDMMDEIADTLLSRDISQNHTIQVDDLSNEFEVYYQLNLDQQTLTQSKDFPVDSAPLIWRYGHDHYAYAWSEKKLWRYYQLEDKQRHMQVTLFQPLTERFEGIWGSITIYGAGLIILWLLQLFLLNFLIRKQFFSIKRLSQRIAAKDINDLSPIQSIEPEFVELQPILQQLNLLLSRLQHSLAAEQRFTADAAHELRSPLSAMKMRLQVLQRKYAGQLNALQPELDSIQSDLNRGIQVLENLLLLARLDPTEQQQLHKERFDLYPLLHEVIHSLEPFIEEKHVEIQVDVTKNVPEDGLIWAQREFLYICIRNLVDNAIRYSNPASQVKISYRWVATQSILEIEDQGHQLTAESLARMGERFYRALGSKTQGSGLGLSICKKIVELHQGQLEFNRAESGGLVVRLILPNN